MGTLGKYAQRIGGAPRSARWNQKGWSRGQNSFAEDNEIRDNEFYLGQNIEIVGKSSLRLGRRGSREFTTVSGATAFNGWGIYKDPKTSVNVMIVQISGRVYKVTTAGVVTEIDNTKTWDTSARMRGVQLRESFYFGNATDYMAKTDGSTVTRWNALTAPTFNSVVLTGSGTDTLYSYVVTTVTANGETESSSEIEEFGPSDLDASNYLTLTWNRDTDSDVTGYNVYKSINGGTLLLLTFIDQQASGSTMTYADDGTETQSLIHEAPTFGTTGGVKGDLFGTYANSLFVSGNTAEPDTVFYGGTGAQWESFAPSANGGWIKVGRGDGEVITAMIGFDDFLLIFKESSIWKFVFGSDGGPTLSAVIPQYGTSSPDTVWRMEKDVVFLGSDGRVRVLGYEPNQLNVIRTTDISNRIQDRLDEWDKTNIEDFIGVFFDQKFILCNKTQALPYDRRYLGYLGTWTNYTYDSFIVWDKGTKSQLLFGVQTGTGVIDQLLVDNTWDDDGSTIPVSIRFKREDGGDDSILKYWEYSHIKLKNPRGQFKLYTYRDGSQLVDETSVAFDVGGGVGEYMFGEGMFGEGVEITDIADAINLLTKEIYEEAYSIYHQITLNANDTNHTIVQTLSGYFQPEDKDYFRDNTII